MGYVNAAGAVAGANYDTVIGREAVSGRYGQLCQAGGKFTTVGDAQICRMIARKQTTDATATVMALDGGGTATATRTSIGTDRSAAFSALVVGRRVSAGGEASAAYEIKGLIKNDGGAVAFVGTPSVTVLGETDAAWDCTVNANDTTNALEILVTGAAGVTVNWVAEVTFVESAG